MSTERREQGVEELAKEMGGPLTALDIEKMLKDPNSILNKALAGFVTQKVQNEMMARWTAIFNMIIECKKEIMGRAQVVVTARGEDFDPRTSASEKGPDFSIVPIVFPESVQQLQAEIKTLQTQSNELKAKLETSQSKQRDDFDEDVQKLGKTDPELKQKLNFTVLTFEKQKEFSAIYEDRAKGIDELFKVSKGELNRTTLEKSVGYKTELLMASDMLKREGDKNLNPSEVKALSKAILGKYVERQGKHHTLAQDMKAVEQMMATKIEALVKETKDFAQHYKIPKAPPPPAPHPRLKK